VFNGYLKFEDLWHYVKVLHS